MDIKSWKTVVVIGMVLGAVITMAALKLDTGVIFELLALLGIGGTLGVAHSVKQNVNGNLKLMIDKLGDAMDKLSKAMPIPVDTSAPPIDSSKDGD